MLAETEGNLALLSQKINTTFQSISLDLPPLEKPQFEVSPNYEVPAKYVVSVSEVEKRLMSIKIHKSPGPDSVPNWILRDFAPVLSGPIASIVNSSIRESHVPQLWKSADTLPMPKISPPKIINKDLRPISLTPVVSKSCLEDFVYAWLWDCIKDKLDPNQFGGVKGSSPVYALIKLLHDAYMTTDNLLNTFEIVMVDFAKAFDHINHRIVLNKLEDMGVPPILLRWIHSFLFNRQQRVKIGNLTSTWCYLNGGVPQGTKIAILLFLVMINDLDPICSTIKFVDDVTGSEGKTLVGPSVMGGSLIQVKSWSNDNDMDVNPSKTKRLLINFSNNKDSYHELHFDTELIDLCSKAKLLGVIIQDNLKWDSHVCYIVSRASQLLHYIRTLKRSGYSDKDLIQIYTGKLRSILEYACQVWHPGLTLSLSQDIERVQIRALKIIRPDLQYHEALDMYNLPYLDQRRTQICQKTYSQIKQPNHVLHSLLPPIRETNYNLRSKKQRVSHRTRVKRSDNSFINYAVNHFE